MYKIFRKNKDETFLDKLVTRKLDEAQEHYAKLCEIRTKEASCAIFLENNLQKGYFRLDENWPGEREQVSVSPADEKGIKSFLARIPDNEYGKLREIAFIRNISINRLLNDILNDFLEAEKTAINEQIQKLDAAADCFDKLAESFKNGDILVNFCSYAIECKKVNENEYMELVGNKLTLSRLKLGDSQANIK